MLWEAAEERSQVVCEDDRAAIPFPRDELARLDRGVHAGPSQRGHRADVTDAVGAQAQQLAWSLAGACRRVLNMSSAFELLHALSLPPAGSG
jgi:hypothetical protein